MSVYFKNEIPYLEDQNLLELSKIIQTPFYLYSQKTITDTFIELKKSLNKEIFFAIKANSNQAIIALLSSLGAGADVVSVEEMQRAIKAGVPPKKIIFEGVGKSILDIQDAIKFDIRQINIESIKELEIINEISNSLNKKVSIGIRVNPNIDASTIEKISTGRKTDKFGIDFNLLPILCEKLTFSRNLQFQGLTCHIGSQIFEIEVYKKMFEKMKQAIKIFQSHNFPIKHLDLGGGFGVPYQENQKKLDITKLSLLINKSFPNPSFKISFEPGRYLVANAGFLITKILTAKTNGDINYLITDAGMQSFLRPALYNAQHKILPFNNNGKEKIFTIAGPICESSDILARNIKLPYQKDNDYLIICNVGAYGSVMASHYNSKCLPAEVLINKKNYAIIRYPEKIEEIIARDKIPNWL